MRIAYTPEQERLRLELRDYFGRLMTDEVRAAIDARRRATTATATPTARWSGSSARTAGWR